MSLPSVNIAQSFFLALSPWIYILGGFASLVFALTRWISSHIKQCHIETGKVVEPLMRESVVVVLRMDEKC
jgi:hypothetical protein